MNVYHDKPTAQKELDDFPGLSSEDLDTVDRLFTQYLFFNNEKDGRTVWTTCCHRNAFIGKLSRTVTPEDRLVLRVKHNEYVTCPYCGRVVYAKNRRMLRRGVKLEEYHAVVFLHVSEDGNTVWAQGYWSTRDLMGDPSGPVLYKVTRVYRFQPGKAEQWDMYFGNTEKRKHPKILEPCMDNGIAPYKPVGLERLDRSFLRYTGYAEPMPNSGMERKVWQERGERSDLIRYLAAAARYPRQVELMRKAGMGEPLGDLVWAWKKNADVIKWSETDPCKAFGLTKPEMKEFLAGRRDMDTLRVLKNVRKLGGRLSVTEAETLNRIVGKTLLKRVLERAENYNIPVNALLKYLESFTGPRCHGSGVTFSHVARYWADYMDMANQLGYDLSNPVWQMPRDLEEKHDRLAEAVNAVRIAQQRELAQKRHQEAQKRYGFEMDGWIIRAPMDGTEITAEGRALKHCVGGYADRHMSGALTILFLRRADDPDTPYVTIEMNGNRMVQIHGYKNEMEDCPENPDKRPPQETHRELLDIWLKWVEKGSKRNKDGAPVLPKHTKNQKEKKTA